MLLMQAESFPVHTANHLGPLTRLTVGYRPSFPGDRWHLDRVEVTDEGTGLLYIFFSSALLGDDQTTVVHLQVDCILTDIAAALHLLHCVVVVDHALYSTLPCYVCCSAQPKP